MSGAGSASSGSKFISVNRSTIRCAVSSGFVPVGGRDEGGCPVPAGLFGASSAGAGGGAEVSGENGRERPVPVGRGLLGAGGVDGAGSPGGGPRGLLNGDLFGPGEYVQVEPDGGDVQPGRVGELVDVQGGVAAAE